MAALGIVMQNTHLSHAHTGLNILGTALAAFARQGNPHPGMTPVLGVAGLCHSYYLPISIL
jgi:hypothetical protein